VGPGADTQEDVGRRELQVLDKHLRHFVVVVLSGMYHQELEVLPGMTGGQYRSQFHHVGPGADHGDDFHLTIPPDECIVS